MKIPELSEPYSPAAINSVTFKGIDYKALDVLSITGPNLSTPGTATVDTIG